MTDTKELRKLAEEATVICVKCGYNGPSEPAHLRPVGGTLCDYSAHKTVLLLADQLTGLLDTIEAQAAEIERQNATIDSYINTAAVLAAKVEAQSAEIERLKASFTNELDSLSNRNYQLRMANADQAALLKRCKEAMGWHYRCTDCTEELAAIEQWENGK